LPAKYYSSAFQMDTGTWDCSASLCIFWIILYFISEQVHVKQTDDSYFYNLHMFPFSFVKYIMIQDIKAVNVVLWPSRQRDSSREILEPRHSFPFWHCNTRKLFSRENNDLLSATTVWYGIVSVQGSRYEKFQTSLRGFIKLRYQFPCVTVIINQRESKVALFYL